MLVSIRIFLHPRYRSGNFCRCLANVFANGASRADFAADSEVLPPPYVVKTDHGISGMTACYGELFADFKRSVAMRQGIETIEQLKPPAAGTYE